MSTFFDPSQCSWHRTQAQWVAAGPSDRWYLNAFLYTMVHDEALCLLPSGAIIRFFVNEDNMVDVEVDYDEC